MDILNNIATSIGLGSLDSVASNVGLDPIGSLGPLIIGVILLLIIVKLLSMPFKLVWNGIYGAALLWIINLLGSFVGFNLKITVIKALIAGFFGVLGALAVILYELFV